MPTFSADQIINKALIAKKNVTAYRTPFSINKIATKYTSFKPGDFVGNVYSYVQDGSNLHWMFYDNAKKPYYIMHEPEAFNVESLRDQGVKTTAEIEKEKAQAELTPIERAAGAVGSGVKKILIWGGVGLGVFLLLREFIRKK